MFQNCAIEEKVKKNILLKKVRKKNRDKEIIKDNPVLKILSYIQKS